MVVVVGETGAYQELTTCQARFLASQQAVTRSDPCNRL